MSNEFEREAGHKKDMKIRCILCSGNAAISSDTKISISRLAKLNNLTRLKLTKQGVSLEGYVCHTCDKRLFE